MAKGLGKHPQFFWLLTCTCNISSEFNKLIQCSSLDLFSQNLENSVSRYENVLSLKYDSDYSPTLTPFLHLMTRK